uniref:Large ribosomal subunit protein uL23c n=1 Tax=Microthamnion kuetzingianum TaxID=34148 RepID=A0A097KNG2_9CHLO|nr:ribosomal protein L23 [Microthamnion kuetzingianum]AIT94712.1 ribosomal protein L23 [Microthamnion kuetzingianum]
MSIDLVKHCVLTEKLIKLVVNNQYTFDVDLRLNKTQIKGLIEELFNIKIIAVNTHRLPRKKKRVGATQGSKTQYKRAIITAKAGESINFFNEIN